MGSEGYLLKLARFQMQQNIKKQEKLQLPTHIRCHKETLGYNFINFNHIEGIERRKDYKIIVVYYKL